MVTFHCKHLRTRYDVLERNDAFSLRKNVLHINGQQYSLVDYEITLKGVVPIPDVHLRGLHGSPLEDQQWEENVAIYDLLQNGASMRDRITAMLDHVNPPSNLVKGEVPIPSKALSAQMISVLRELGVVTRPQADIHIGIHEDHVYVVEADLVPHTDPYEGSAPKLDLLLLPLAMFDSMISMIQAVLMQYYAEKSPTWTAAQKGREGREKKSSHVEVLDHLWGTVPKDQ